MNSTKLVIFLGAVDPRPERLTVPVVAVPVVAVPVVAVPIPIAGTSILSCLLGAGVGEEQLETPFHLMSVETLQGIGSTLKGSELQETSGKLLASVSIAH